MGKPALDQDYKHRIKTYWKEIMCSSVELAIAFNIKPSMASSLINKAIEEMKFCRRQEIKVQPTEQDEYVGL